MATRTTVNVPRTPRINPVKLLFGAVALVLAVAVLILVLRSWSERNNNQSISETQNQTIQQQPATTQPNPAIQRPIAPQVPAGLASRILGTWSVQSKNDMPFVGHYNIKALKFDNGKVVVTWEVDGKLPTVTYDYAVSSDGKHIQVDNREFNITINGNTMIITDAYLQMTMTK